MVRDRHNPVLAQEGRVKKHRLTLIAVRGPKKIRIIDAAIRPDGISGNTEVTSVMTGETAERQVLDDHCQSRFPTAFGRGVREDRGSVFIDDDQRKA